MKRKEFVIFGVGEFGTNVAKTLANSGATIMVVDKDEKQLEIIGENGYRKAKKLHTWDCRADRLVKILT